MRDLTNEILELIRRTSSDLPPDVEKRSRAAVGKEAPGSAARGAFETILKNVELSRKNSSPICQDTGTPIFYVKYPEGWSTLKLKKQIRTALAESTDNKLAVKVLKDIADEERVHVGEFLRLLHALAPDEEKFYTKGAKEVEEMIEKMK